MKRIRLYRAVIAVLVLVILAETAWIIREVRGKAAGAEEWDFDVDEELSARFETALTDGSIQVWFQPIADAATGRTAGAEALSRWKDGDEYISPSVFVSVLEETGQVTELDRNVFRQACLFQKERLEAGEKLSPISVNLSVLTTMQEGIADEYRQVLEEEGLPADCIRIEVTETLDSDKAQLLKTAKAFHEAGFLLEIDDFGAGYASLGNLAVIPYDVLKIDKSLIDALGSERGNLLVTDILRMAKDFDMTVIAEGVETEEQAAFLRDAACDAIQGYYFAKPMPKEDFFGYLSSEKGN